MNTKEAVLRFDIDTVTDARVGMPCLLDILRRNKIKATFFVTVGRSISLKDNLMDMNRSFANLMGMGKEPPVKKISGLKKLKAKGFLETIFFNPYIARSSQNIIASAFLEGHELALHGGKGHSAWVRGAAGWKREKIARDVRWAQGEFKDLFGFIPKGFSAPGFVMTDNILEEITALGFKYNSGLAGQCNSAERGRIKDIPVNVIGPNTVPLIENLAASGYGADDISKKVKGEFNSLHEKGSTPILYGHPSAEGALCGDIFEKVIKDLIEDGWRFVLIRKLLEV